MSSEDINTISTRVGLRDRLMAGWCNGETGELVPGVKVNPGMKVVDIGCGDGGYITFCSRQGADVTFIDIQEQKVKALEERLSAESSAKVEGIVSECNPIPIADGYADLVMSTEVLEHVREPKAFLDEIVRVGSKDATYVLTVPDARAENMILDIAPPINFQEPNHINIFSSDDFEALADSCGLEVVRHEYLAGFWAIFYLLKWATCEPGEVLNQAVHPATYHWSRAWEEMLDHPNGNKVREALNLTLPRCQVIVARRKGANVS